MNILGLRRSSALSSGALVAAMMLASPAYAQGGQAQQDETAPRAPGRNADGSDSEQSIVVTGSRIRTPNLESAEPVTTLDSRQVRERNFTNAADALNELPGFRGSVTPAGAQGSFGQGVNFVNNYGLGSNRTLTLINGRRFVTSNVVTLFNQGSQGTQVDLNVVPVILLDRIDTISIGGSPVYGSDAISGTVNVILRNEYQGFEFSALAGISEEGDNARYNVSALVGHTFGERLNVTVAVSHDRIDGVLFNARDFLRDNVGNITNPSLAVATTLRPGNTANPAVDNRLNASFGFNNSITDNTPGTVLIRNVRIPFLTRGGLITRTNLSDASPLAPASRQFCRNANPLDPASCFDGASGDPTTTALQFAPDGSLIPFNQGVLTSGTSNSGGDGFAFNDFSQITSDLNRTIVNAFLTFEITPNIELFGEGTYYRSRADELVQQPTFNSNIFGGTSGQLQFSVDSPFLTPQARAALVARGVTVFQISRASLDLADLTGFNETRIYRLVGGIRGDFQMFGRDFNFEAYANWGEANSVDFGQNINNQNFINAVNVNAAGQCTILPTVPAGPATVGAGFAAPGGTPIADPNCVPLNVLGEGRASQAARDYVIEDTQVDSTQTQVVYNINVGGSLFDVWGGPVAFNIGYEHREEEAEFIPNAFLQAGQGRSVPITPLQGGYNLDEVFGEIQVPLISPDTNLSFIESLQVFGRGRYVDNTVNGGFFSWAAGGSIAFVRDIEFRGNYTRSFRSPAITELFLPVVSAFNTVPDLCSLATRNAGPAPAVRAANCAAFLARFPNATPDPAATATVPSLSGGNPNLENERANSWSVGAIIRPRWIPRLSLTVDYINITIRDPIANLTVAQVASACFDNTEFNTADLLNANAFCSLIRRDPVTGRVSSTPADPGVRTGFVNGQQIQFRGIQGTIDYSLPIRDFGFNGTLTIGGDWLYVRKRLNDITGVAPTRTDGILGDPEWSGQLRVRYEEEQWGINTTINYVGEQLTSRLNRSNCATGTACGLDAREFDKFDDYVTVNASIFFEPVERLRLTFSVTNLFNRQGQEYFGVLIPASFNDLLGRRFAASARLRF